MISQIAQSWIFGVASSWPLLEQRIWWGSSSGGYWVLGGRQPDVCGIFGKGSQLRQLGIVVSVRTYALYSKGSKISLAKQKYPQRQSAMSRIVFKRSPITKYGERYSWDVTPHDGICVPLIGHSIDPSWRSPIINKPLCNGWQYGMHVGPPRTGNDSSSNVTTIRNGDIMCRIVPSDILCHRLTLFSGGCVTHHKLFEI